VTCRCERAHRQPGLRIDVVELCGQCGESGPSLCVRLCDLEDQQSSLRQIRQQLRNLKPVTQYSSNRFMADAAGVFPTTLVILYFITPPGHIPPGESKKQNRLNLDVAGDLSNHDSRPANVRFAHQADDNRVRPGQHRCSSRLVSLSPWQRQQSLLQRGRIAKEPPRVP
jgi:hypothetical protein